MKSAKIRRDKAVIVVVDIQERLLPAMKDPKGITKKATMLIEGGRILDIPILVTEQYPKGLGKTMPDLSALTSIDAFEKTQFSAYTEDIKSAIFKSGKINILVIGMETHVCVYQTVRALLDAEYNVFVVKDCVASRTQDNYENALDLMKDMGAVITNMETVLFDILKKAGTPEFKIVSKLIK